MRNRTIHRHRNDMEENCGRGAGTLCAREGIGLVDQGWLGGSLFSFWSRRLKGGTDGNTSYLRCKTSVATQGFVL
jgi:hypothetical protein